MSDVAAGRPTWAWAGLATVGLFAAGALAPFPAVSEDAQDDPARLVRALEGHEVSIFVRNGISWLGVAALLVFVVGLFRHLAAHHPSGALTPDVALAGGLVTGAGLFVGYGMLASIGGAVYDDRPATTVAAVYSVGDGLAYSMWTGIGAVGAAVALAGIRRRGAARWMGYVSAGFTVLFALLAFFPFLSWIPALIWLLVTSSGYLLMGRRAR